MRSYYLQLALQEFRRSPWIMALIVLAVGVGIGSSMTVYSLLRAMASDPIAHKSGVLFAPRIDTHGPHLNRGAGTRMVPGEPAPLMTYRDAVALRDARLGVRQAVMYGAGYQVRTEGPEGRSMQVPGRATDADFFAMFDVPLARGRFWGAEEDRDGARVVVISEVLARYLFGTDDVLGRTLLVNESTFEVIGVAREWAPRPRFYDLGLSDNTREVFGTVEVLFLPLSAGTAMIGVLPGGPNDCTGSTDNGGIGARTREQWLNGECRWTHLWVELPAAADVRRYREYLANYAAEQQASGRFGWLPDTRLYDVRLWLAVFKVVPDEYRIANLLALSFLGICLVNAMALIAASLRRRTEELTLRRALGATRHHLLGQCLAGMAVIGAMGAALGLLLAWGGMVLQEHLLSADVATLPAASAGVVMLAVTLGIAGTVFAGLLPAWLASSGRAVRTDRRPARLGAGRLLIVAQVAVTLAVVTNGLFVALQKLEASRRPTGADEDALLLVQVLWPREHADMRARVERDLAALRLLPGVRGATAGGLPMLTAYFGGTVSASREGPAFPVGAFKQVDEHALDVWGIRLAEGRWFRREEIGVTGRPGVGVRPAPVLVITRELADKLYPGGPAVGQDLYIGGMDAASFTVVGVVDTFLGAYGETGGSTVFTPSVLVQGGYVSYGVRADPASLEATGLLAVRRLLEIDPARIVGEPDPQAGGQAGARPFSQVRSNLTRADRGVATLLAFTCALLLLVTALGVIGVTASRVIQRRNDIGIRRAIGARRWHILAQVQYENLLVVMAGVLPGVVGALLLNQWLAREYAMRLLDPRGLAGGAALVILLGQLASFWPALRASMVPPAAAARAN